MPSKPINYQVSSFPTSKESRKISTSCTSQGIAVSSSQTLEEEGCLQQNTLLNLFSYSSQ